MKTSIILLTTLLIFSSCTTRKTNNQKLEAKRHELVEGSRTSTNNLSTENQEVKNEIAELKNIISNLNINYVGKNLDDKLDVLLKQNSEGTKLTISGTGTASFREDAHSEVKILKKELVKYWDSLHVEQISEIKNLKTEITQEIITKEIQTKNWGLSWWLIPIIILIPFAFKHYLPQLFKGGLNSVIKLFK